MAIDRGLNATVSSNPLGIDDDDYVATVVGPQGIQGDTGATGATGATGSSSAGDMLAANNLSDLINITTARTNLGLEDITLDGGYF